MLEHCAPLPDATLRRLEDFDREAKRQAWHQGHLHALARGAAINSDGRLLGRAR